MATTHLVTGASGFIGKRLVARLARDGGRVRALVLPDEAVTLEAPRGFPGTLPDQITRWPLARGAEVVRGDVTRPETLATAMRGATLVYHLAARVADWGPDAGFQAVNVDGTRNVLVAAAAAGVERVVVVSSLVVYGGQLGSEICDEDLPREYGIGPYSRSKRGQEEVALDFHGFGRVPVTVVRPGNVYGPGSVNWVDLPIGLLRAGRLPLIDAGDGGGQGDAALTWVDNLVDLLCLAARTPAAAGRVYNANDGGGVTWARYFADLARLAGARPPRISVPARIALGAALAMETAWRLARRETRPLLTREAVTLLASRHPVPISRAARELGFAPAVEYDQTLQVLERHLAQRSGS